MNINKLVLIISLSLFSFNLYSQEVIGYPEQKGIYDYKDSTYYYQNISGVSFTFDIMVGESKKIPGKETEILRIGSLETYGTTYNDYEIIDKTFASDSNEYDVYLSKNKFGGIVALKISTTEFFLLYLYDNNIWRQYYKGIIIKNFFKNK